MKIEKKMTIMAPIEDVWDSLLDPKKMVRCVPGTQSVEELSDTEYRAEVKIKISFISANFKVLTKIVEQDSPKYLKCEGTGEDSKVASSMKQVTELFLTKVGGNETEILVKAEVQVFGRLGSFGLSIMKTKVDRLWKEFAANLFERMKTTGAV